MLVLFVELLDFSVKLLSLRGIIRNLVVIGDKIISILVLVNDFYASVDKLLSFN